MRVGKKKEVARRQSSPSSPSSPSSSSPSSSPKSESDVKRNELANFLLGKTNSCLWRERGRIKKKEEEDVGGRRYLMALAEIFAISIYPPLATSPFISRTRLEYFPAPARKSREGKLTTRKGRSPAYDGIAFSRDNG
ncbi:hypothetical protein V1477_018288 [Vespula maculifrons]|uniref:Uncharacterized protein n=1 Tax=Vespula maculifrons TaxID=7453 RepID=A0ABD2AZF2_VESMC